LTLREGKKLTILYANDMYSEKVESCHVVYMLYEKLMVLEIDI